MSVNAPAKGAPGKGATGRVAADRRHARSAGAWQRAAAGLVALAALALLVLPVPTIATLLPGGGLAEGNRAFLHAARQASLTDVLLLGELTAFVSVLQTIDVGVSVGVSANVEVGQALAALGHGLERGMAAAMVGAGFYELTMLVAALAERIVPYLIKLLALGALLHLAAMLVPEARLIRRTTRIALEYAVIGFLVLRLALPYGIAATSAVANVASAEILGHSRATIQQMHAQIADTGTSTLSVLSRTDERAIRKAFERTAADFPRNLEAVGDYALRRAALSLVEGILLPFGIAFVLFMLGRRLARDVFPVLP